MIIMKIKGGLGNQMFQYALGRHLSLKHNCRLCLDVSEYEYDPLRKFRLDSYKLSDYKTTTKPRDLQKVIHKIQQKIRPIQTYIEPQFTFNPEALTLKNMCLDGYWQTEKYFSEIREILLNDFTLQAPLQKELLPDLEKIQSTNSVSVHIRRGDYTKPGNLSFHGIVEQNWYEQAIQLINEKVENPSFFFFSDDIEFTKSIFPEQENYHYMNTSPDGFEHQDMFLMSNCKHNIIANSSFSWWAAWLNKNPSKLVIAPEKWFATQELDPRDIIPVNWIKI